MKHYSKIKEKFEEKAFTINDLCRLLNVKRSTAYWIMYGLKEKNLIVKPLRGLYKAYTPKIIRPPKEIERLQEHLLKRITRKFSFTGLSILESFIHHVPYVLIYHLFVEPNSGEDFESEIKKFSNIIPLIEPKIEDINLILKTLPIKKLIVIRENNYFYSSKNGLSSKEAAFIDLYFEVTRDKMPFIRTDLYEIFKSLSVNNLINYSLLIKYAKERGIKKEIKNFLKERANALDIPKEILK